MTDAIKRAREKARELQKDWEWYCPMKEGIMGAKCLCTDPDHECTQTPRTRRNTKERVERVTAAILDARNEGRNEGLEEAVRIADKHSQKGFHSWAPGEIAAEIRALKEPT